MTNIRHSLFLLACSLLVACSMDASAALAAGERAPAIKAQGWLAGQPFPFELEKALRDGPVVVYFFPAANTPGCNIEAALFSQAIGRFKARGASVIGVTAGNTDQLRSFSSDTKTCAGKFPVAGDSGARIATTYGAVIEGRADVASRTSFLVARDGRIAAVHSDMNPSGHVKAMLAGVDALGPAVPAR